MDQRPDWSEPAPAAWPGALSVSVVVPMHNAADTIERCLASIAAQTRPAERVIVIDDGSTDDGSQRVEAVGQGGLELVRLPVNRGPGVARNEGFRRSSSELVAFLDADNTWQPEFLEHVVGALEQLGADFASGGGVRIKMAPRQTTIRRLLAGPEQPRDLTADYWRVSLRFLPVVPSSGVVSRAAFERVGGFPEDMRTGEDVVFFARLWLAGRLAFVNRNLYTSYQMPTSLTAGRRSYRDMRLLLGRVGGVLIDALRQRRAGSGWFGVAYLRMVVGRHATWLAQTVGRR